MFSGWTTEEIFWGYDDDSITLAAQERAAPNCTIYRSKELSGKCCLSANTGNVGGGIPGQTFQLFGEEKIIDPVSRERFKTFVFRGKILNLFLVFKLTISVGNVAKDDPVVTLPKCLTSASLLLLDEVDDLVDLTGAAAEAAAVKLFG